MLGELFLSTCTLNLLFVLIKRTTPLILRIVVRKSGRAQETLAGKRRNLSKPVKEKEGRNLNKEAEQISRWKKTLQRNPQRDPPAEIPDIPIAEMLLSVNTNPP